MFESRVLTWNLNEAPLEISRGAADCLPYLWFLISVSMMLRGTSL